MAAQDLELLDAIVLDKDSELSALCRNYNLGIKSSIIGV